MWLVFWAFSGILISVVCKILRRAEWAAQKRTSARNIPADAPLSDINVWSESGLLFAASASLARAVGAALAIDALTSFRCASRGATHARFELGVHSIGSRDGSGDGRQQDQDFFHRSIFHVCFGVDLRCGPPNRRRYTPKLDAESSSAARRLQ